MPRLKLSAVRNYRGHQLFGVLCLVIPLFLIITRLRDASPLSSTGTSSYRAKSVHHVVFLKVHKTASTTLMNVFMRYGLSKNLTIMVPRRDYSFSQSTTLKQNQFLHYSPTGIYDILCCHVIYNKSAIAPFFPPDTRYIGTVREPFQQFVSSFHYYRNLWYLSAIPGNDKLSSYLKNPQKFEPTNVALSFTNNRMSFDFGFPPKEFKNTSYMHIFLEKLVKEVDFVIVVEYFDESILLMKRLLNWNLEDILYIPRNRAKRRRSFEVTDEHRVQHKDWAKLDYLLYERFLKIFLVKLQKQPAEFYAELNFFRSTRQDVENFCKSATQRDYFKVQESPWNEEFVVPRFDCKHMLMEGMKLIKKVRGGYISRMDLV